jgi:hypothetical protein
MKINRRLRIILKYVLPTLAVMVIVPLLQKTYSTGIPFEGDRIRCVIAIDGRASRMNYPIGYNYEMLQLFAAQMDKNTEIFLGGREYLDSLREGSVDIVVLPYSDSLVESRDYFVSVPLADSSSWIIDGRLEIEHKTINLWLSSFSLTQAHKRTADRFTPAYEPLSRMNSGRAYSTLSPYDDLLRKYSAETGIDRFLFTALVWQESKFRIEVKSRRGAVGLMQLMPNTAGRFEAENLLDPEVNISTASKYLGHLRKMFSADAENQEELVKFILAAYNAGEGRIRDCINYAASIGAPHSRWDDIVAIIPDMREDSILDADTVKLGKFKGYETIRYVENIEILRNAFRAIASGQSSQDPPATRKDTAATEEPLSRDMTDSLRQEPEKH